MMETAYRGTFFKDAFAVWEVAILKFPCYNDNSHKKHWREYQEAVVIDLQKSG